MAYCGMTTYTPCHYLEAIKVSDLVILEGLVIGEAEMEWTFARSSGPGGQNVNKVNSKAILRWVPRDDFLSPAAWVRFRAIAGRFLTTDGAIVVHSQEFRDQLRNIERCREKLREMLSASLNPPKRRVRTQPSKASKLRRLDTKRKSAIKRRLRQIPEN